MPTTYSIADIIEIGLVESGKATQQDVDGANKAMSDAEKYADSGYYRTEAQKAEDAAVAYVAILEGKVNDLISSVGAIGDDSLAKMLTSGAAKVMEGAQAVASLLTLVPTSASYMPSFKAKASDLFPSVKEIAKAKWMDAKIKAQDYINNLKSLEPTTEMLTEVLMLLGDEVYSAVDEQCQKYTGYTFEELMLMAGDGIRMYKEYKRREKTKRVSTSVSADFDIDTKRLKDDMLNWLYEQADSMYNGFLIINMVNEIKDAAKNFSRMKVMTPRDIEEGISQFEAFMAFLDELGINAESADQAIGLSDFISINGIKNELTSKVKSLASKSSILNTAQDLAGKAMNSITLNLTVTQKTLNYSIEILDVYSGILKLTLYGNPALEDNSSQILKGLKSLDLFSNAACQQILNDAKSVFANMLSGEEATFTVPSKEKDVADYTMVIAVEQKAPADPEDTDAARSGDPDVVSVDRYDLTQIASRAIRVQDDGPHRHVTLPLVGMLYKYLVTLEPSLRLIGTLISNYRTNKNRASMGMNLQITFDRLSSLYARWSSRSDESQCILLNILGMQTYTIRKTATYNLAVEAGVLSPRALEAANRVGRADLDVTATRKLMAILPGTGLDRDKGTCLFIKLDDDLPGAADGSSDGMSLFVDDEFGYVLYADSDKDELNTEIGRCVRDGLKAFDYQEPAYPEFVPDAMRKPAADNSADKLMGHKSIADLKRFVASIGYGGTVQEYLGNNGLSAQEISDALAGKYDQEKAGLSDDDKDFIRQFNSRLNASTRTAGEALPQTIDFSKISACDFSKDRDWALPRPNGIQTPHDMALALNDAADFIRRHGLDDRDKKREDLEDAQDFISGILSERIRGNHAIIEFAADCLNDDAVEYKLSIAPGQELDSETYIGSVEQYGAMRPLKSIFAYGTVRERDSRVERMFSKRCSRHFIVDDFCVGPSPAVDIEAFEDFNQKFSAESQRYDFIKDNLCYSALPDILCNRHNSPPNPLFRFRYSTGLEIYKDWCDHFEDTVESFFEKKFGKDFKNNRDKAGEKAAEDIKACGINQDKQKALAAQYIGMRAEFLENEHSWKSPCGGLISLWENFRGNREKCMGDYKYKDCQLLGVTYYPELLKYVDPSNQYGVKYRSLIGDIISIRNSSENVSISAVESYINDAMIRYGVKGTEDSGEQPESKSGSGSYAPLAEMRSALGDSADIGEITAYLTERLDASADELQMRINHIANLYIFYVQHKGDDKKTVYAMTLTDARGKLADLLSKYGYRKRWRASTQTETAEHWSLSANPCDDMYAELGDTDDDYEIAAHVESFASPERLPVSDADMLEIAECYASLLEFKRNPGKTTIEKDCIPNSELYKLTLSEKERLNAFWESIIMEYRTGKSAAELIDDFSAYINPSDAEWPAPIEIDIDGETYSWYLFDKVHDRGADAVLEDESWDDAYLDEPVPGDPGKIDFTEDEARDALTEGGLEKKPELPDCASYKYWQTYWAIGTMVNCIPSFWATGLMLPVPLVFIPGPLISICIKPLLIKELDMLLVFGIGVRIPFNIKPMIQYVALSDKPRNILFPITIALEQIKQLFLSRIQTLEFGVGNLVQLYIDKLESENMELTKENTFLKRQAEELKSISFPGWEDLREELECMYGGLNPLQAVDRMKERFSHAKKQKQAYKEAMASAGDNQAAIQAIRNSYYATMDTTYYTSQLTQLAVDKIYNSSNS